MYNSPIRTGLMYRELVKEVNEDTDEDIYKAVVACGVDVDRDELLRALRYDRGQYDEGFAAGYRAATPKWISVTERLPVVERDVLVCYRFEGSDMVFIGTLTYFRFDKNPHWQHEATGVIVTHWMPLPAAPKEAE